MKKIFTLTLLTLVMAFMSISGLHSQESNKVLLIIRDGSPDLEFMLKEEVGVMKETLEAAGFKVDIATLTGEPISAGSVKLKPDLKLNDVSVRDYDGFILPCMATDPDVASPIPDEIIMLVKGVTNKPIAAQLGAVQILAKAGLLKDKKYASAIEFDYPYFEGSVLTGTGVVRDGYIITSGICPFMARRDEIKDGTEELANALVKAIKTGTN
jgi:putative intracellular protease/amidase